MQLLEAANSNVVTAAEENYSYLQTIFVWGVFDGATVRLQGSPDGNEWFDLANFNAKEVLGIGLNVRFLRASVTNAGATTNLNLLVE